MSTDVSHIAIVIGSMRMGGAERATLNLVNGFAEMGIRCDLVLVKTEGVFLGELHPEVNIVSLGRGRALFSGFALSRYLKRIRPQLIIANQTHVHLLTLWSRNRTAKNIPVILNEHSLISRNLKKGSWKTKLIMFLAHRWFKSANAVSAVSQGVADELVNNFPELISKTTLVYNPVVNDELVKKSFENINLPWPNENPIPVVLGAGRLVPDKDFKNLIEALSMLRIKRRVRLVILGDGPERDELMNIAQQLNFGSDISFQGNISNPFAWMRSCSMFVLPSRREGLPMTLIEAIACDCPVVSTDCQSGPGEILNGGLYGKLVPVGDPVAMAKAIEETLDNKGIDFDKGTALKPFLVSSVCENYLALIQKLLSEKSF